MQTTTATQLLVSLDEVSVKRNGQPALHHLSLQVYRGQHWAIIGGSGSGKSTLTQVLQGNLFFSGRCHWHFTPGENSTVIVVEQQHHFKNRSNTSQFYYQQRFNAADAGDSMTVADVLANYSPTEPWIELLQLGPLWNKPLLQLSNGENKRLQLAGALLANPAVLVLDNPFVGLDTDGRKILHTLLNSIADAGIHVMLVTSPAELPACITHVAVLNNGRIASATPIAAYQPATTSSVLPARIDALLSTLPAAPEADFEWAIRMENVSLRYGDKVILQGIDWAVKRGSCWNVSGPNGSGKSSLLSLVTADNPQAYANKIFLFDQLRGSGETIWDIKARIGFVSPELHLYFEPSSSCYEVVASGWFDTIGLFRRLSAVQEASVDTWLQIMGLEQLRWKTFSQLSASQQRMALLTRALVKNPPLLILDEPTQGLDETQTQFFKQLITAICQRFGSTLVYVSHYSTDLPECIGHYLALGT
ncbi:MAG TPA: ATP-binding cassette domain-containing protein [Chitinophagaceae bacterium]|nr:ATP-binding cassette domain-containing protein [Chitinophagaceae bacterium]